MNIQSISKIKSFTNFSSKMLNLNSSPSASISPYTPHIKEIDLFKQDYEFIKNLGEGCHGVVDKYINKKSEEYFAVKTLRTNDEEIKLAVKKL